MLGEGAIKLEAQCHPERVVLYAADIREESDVSYPERSVVCPLDEVRLTSRFKRNCNGYVEVSRGLSKRVLSLSIGRTSFNRRVQLRSRRVVGADMTAEKPEPRTKVGGGTAKSSSYARQSLPVLDDHPE